MAKVNCQEKEPAPTPKCYTKEGVLNFRFYVFSNFISVHFVSIVFCHAFVEQTNKPKANRMKKKEKTNKQASK